jgi:anti-sigma factor RsiW
MSRCLDAEQFQRLLDEQLSAVERKAVDAHVDACSDCQEELARLLDASEDEPVGLDWQRLHRAGAATIPRSVDNLLRRLKDNLPPSTLTGSGATDAAAPRTIVFPDPPTALGAARPARALSHRGRTGAGSLRSRLPGL